MPNHCNRYARFEVYVYFGKYLEENGERRLVSLLEKLKLKAADITDGLSHFKFIALLFYVEIRTQGGMLLVMMKMMVGIVGNDGIPDLARAR